MAIERVYPSNATQAGLLHEATKSAFDKLYDEADSLSASAVRSGTGGAIASGRRAINPGSSSAFTFAINFPAGRFATPPTVVCAIESALGSYATATVRAINITTTGFTLVANNVGANTTAHYHWIATTADRGE